MRPGVTGATHPADLPYPYPYARRRAYGDRFVRENANPNLAFALHVSVHGHTCCFNLAAIYPFSFKGLDAERAECQLRATACVTFIAATVFVVFYILLFWAVT